MRALVDRRILLRVAACVGIAACAEVALQAQRGRGGAASLGRQNAPFDPTGYWVSLVTEDWRMRMVTPPKGDYESIPLNATGRKVADAWDPVRDEAGGEQCRSYGAPAIMRVPGRLRIGWQDDMTLKIETDAGEQTRLFQFHDPQIPQNRRGREPEPHWQGATIASWERGAIKAITTKLRPGYLRKNGIPYSASAMLTEYVDMATMPDGTQYLVFSTSVHDPMYLTADFITSTHFRKEPDGAKWSPTRCTSR